MVALEEGHEQFLHYRTLPRAGGAGGSGLEDEFVHHEVRRACGGCMTAVDCEPRLRSGVLAPFLAHAANSGYLLLRSTPPIPC